ncbi:MAG: hypothetical protein U1A77_10245 [Pirellulales bacterium]
MVRCLLALALVFGFTLAAVADVAPPPPTTGLKRVPLEHVLILATKMDDYEFYTFERLGINGDEVVGKRLEVNTKDGVPVPSNQSASVRTGVVAIPVQAMEKLGSTEKLAALLHRDNKEKLPAGLVVHETNGLIEDIPVRDSRKKVVRVITASRDEKAGVRFTETQLPTASGAAPTGKAPTGKAPTGKAPAGAAPTDATPATNKSSANFRQPPMGAVVAGVFMSLVIASVGLIFLRKKT